MTLNYIRNIHLAGEERVAVSREQLTRFQEICNQAGVGNSTKFNPHPEDVSAVEDITGDSDLPGIEVNKDDHSGIDCTDDGKPCTYFSSSLMMLDLFYSLRSCFN